MIKLMNNAGRTLGIPGDPAIFLDAGEVKEVTKNQLTRMKKNRLVAQWFEADILSIGDPVAPAEDPGKGEETDSLEERGQVVVEPQGGGYYNVIVDGIQVNQKGLRLEAAHELAAEYGEVDD